MLGMICFSNVPGHMTKMASRLIYIYIGELIV